MDKAKDEPGVVLITLTNNGYINYTLNCLQSLRKIGYRGKIKVYAIGRKAYNSFRLRGYDTTLIEDSKGEGFECFRRGNWANVTYYKFEMITESLKDYDFVLCTDGDIVFKDKKAIEFCLENIGDRDLLIQNDRLEDDDDRTLCSGFMFIRSNERTRRFFDPEELKSEIRVGWDDQVYVNSAKEKVDYKKLPLRTFPNGKYFRDNLGKLDPYMIHFNYIIGHSKAYDILKSGEAQSLYTKFRLMQLAWDLISRNDIKPFRDKYGI